MRRKRQHRNRLSGFCGKPMRKAVSDLTLDKLILDAHFPKPIRDAGSHRGRDPKRLMNLDKL